MRIHGPGGTVAGASTSATRRPLAAGFTLPEAATTPDTRPLSAPRAAGGIDALLAMQSVEEPAERRKRSIARGRAALDVLDELKIGLLSNAVNPTTAARLRDAATALKQSSGDAGLDAVLAEIELRVEVELAKAAGR